MLEDFWYIALPSKKLKQKPVAVTLFDKPFVLFRSHGKPIALEDRCAHRHAPLSKGKVCEGKISCPYHGWQYDNTGQLVFIPSLGTPKNILKIQSYPVEESGGYIWIWPSQKQVNQSPPAFSQLHEKGYSTFRLQNTFNAAVEHCLENFLDCPHASYVHKLWFRTPAQEQIKAILRTDENGAEIEYFKEPRKRSLVWWLLSNAKASMRHTDRFIAPATSRVDYHFSNHRHYIITSHCTPISSNITKVYTTITFKFARLSWFIKPFFHLLSNIIIKQDVKIIKMQSDTMKKFITSEFKSSETDLIYPYIMAFRKAIEIGNTKPEPNKEKEVMIIL